MARPKKTDDTEPVLSKPVREGTLRIRHYCQGIGDCHLLRFPRADGGEFTMLIDCGVHPSVAGGADKMRAIVADIATVTNRIDTLVVTHEHMDHVSGFVSAAATFAKLTVGDVWFGWTENPEDPQARALDSFKADALTSLSLASSRLAASGASAGIGARDSLDAMLGFYFGASGERVRAARDAARALGKGRVVYHEPGSGPLQLDGVAGVKVYILGPPRDLKQLRLDNLDDETYAGNTFGAGPATARSLAIGLGAASYREDWDAPFDPEIGMLLDTVLPLASNPKARLNPREPDAADRRALVDLLRVAYVGPTEEDDSAIRDQSWRRIDSDFLGLSTELALQLDRTTNNCSLVLAFEFANSGRVMLFAADAQVGSWLSWQKLAWREGERVVTGPDLLERTVYLKVAHHGSHNATLREKGLGLMQSPDLAAFIPVNAADAARIGWNGMPYGPLLEALDIRTVNRVLRADASWIAVGPIPEEMKSRNGALTVVDRHPKGLWVEVEVS